MKYELKKHGDVSLIFDTKARYTPFVVCHYFNLEKQEWNWGDYFRDLDAAVEFFNKKIRKE